MEVRLWQSLRGLWVVWIGASDNFTTISFATLHEALDYIHRAGNRYASRA